mgnify:CR=1 FL=1
MKHLKIFIDLTRLNKPIGFMLLFWPCSWGLAYAFKYNQNLELFIYYLVLFFLGSVLMRSAGCIVNDIVDKNFDRQVEITKNRPIASGAISLKRSFFYVLTLCSLAFVILIQFNFFTIILGMSSMILAFTYPFMKRITYWPQLFLGITFNIGCLIGYAAIENQLNFQIIILYLSGIFWTLGYDTIYAHQDREDDLNIGIKSTAILFGNNTKQWIIIFYSLMVLCLILFGLFQDQNIYYFILLIFISAHLFSQIKRLDIENKDKCLSIFKSNQYLGLMVALTLFIGIL